MSKILFVINPISGDQDKEEYINQIDQWAESLNVSIKKWETTGENDADKLKKLLEDHQPEKLIAVGGDGTVMLCAMTVKDKDIALGIIPAGSANGMAAELEIANIEEGLAIIEKGKTIQADMLLFNDKDFGLHISDAGLNAGLVKEFEEEEKRGFLSYARGAASELLNLQKFEAQITLDDKEITEKCHMVAFANARKYGTGAVLSTNGRLDDGLFEIYVLREMSIPGLAGQFFDHVDEAASYCEVYQTKKANVKLSQAQTFQIDGELKDDQEEIKVEVIPACLKLLVP